jgi:hypothetical protein
MKDPVRLLDAGASELERALLRAGASEQPPEGGAARIAAALGLSLAVTASAESAAARTSTAPAASAQLATKSAALGAKWLLLLGGSLVLGIAGYATYRSSRPEHDRQPTAEPKMPASGPDSVSGSVPDSDSVSGSAPAPSKPSTAVPAAKAAHARSIAGEISALDRIREQLSAGDTRAALRALDRYRSTFPGGVLQQEAAALRIEALARAGERAQAAQLAQRFAREHPNSPHLDRIRSLTGGDAR